MLHAAALADGSSARRHMSHALALPAPCDSAAHPLLSAAAAGFCAPQAQRQYKADRKAEEEAVKARLGEWVFNVEAGYYYNAVHRWYYDTKTRGYCCLAASTYPARCFDAARGARAGRITRRFCTPCCPLNAAVRRPTSPGPSHGVTKTWPCFLCAGMYYGGNPVEWTDKPTMPHEARYEVMNKPPPVPAAPAAARCSSGSGPAAVAGQKYAVAGSRVVNKHPLSEVRELPGCRESCQPGTLGVVST